MSYRRVLYCPREGGGDTTRQTDSGQLQKASGRQDLLIFLHTATQYSSDSKLFLLPPQPPYIKRMHFLLLGSKYQRGITARQGPVMASWEQTAVWRWVRTWAGWGAQALPSDFHDAEVALLQPFLWGTGLSIAAAPTQGLLSVLGGFNTPKHPSQAAQGDACTWCSGESQAARSVSTWSPHLWEISPEPGAGTAGICSADATALCPRCLSGRASTL